jgi:hypothetical protein
MYDEENEWFERYDEEADWDVLNNEEDNDIFDDPFFELWDDPEDFEEEDIFV